jgi:type IVB pilus formation R64 PilN family outer membrane protein
MKKIATILLALAMGAPVLNGCAVPGLSSRVARDHAEGRQAVSPVVNVRPVPDRSAPELPGGAADADRRAGEQSRQVVLRRASRPWVASVSVPMGSNEKLPSVFQEPVKLNFDDAASGGKVGLRTVAERLTSVTGVPVRVKPDVFGGEVAAPGGAVRAMAPVSPSPHSAQPEGALPRQGAPARAPVTPRETSVNAIGMRWNGSLEGFLNHVTDLTNLSWEYREGVIVIERFRTEFFEVASLDGETSYAMGLNSSDQGSTGTSGGSGASSSGLSTNNANADVSEKGRAAAMATILSSIQQLIGGTPGSAVVRSDGSGRLAVTATRDAMAKVRDFLRAENESMLRQAQIQFDIYSIRRDESNEQGIEWDLILESIGRAMQMGVSSPATLTGSATGQVNFAILSGPNPPNKLARVMGDSSAVLKLLSQYGNSTQHRPVSLLTLNRQWARKASLGSKAYVSETVPGAASSYGAGAPGLKTATVTTGDRYLAQPYIMDNNTVVLKFGVGLSSLVQIANFTSGSGVTQQTVQTPEISNLIDQSTVALKAGQLLVITGLSRIVTLDDTRTLTEGAPLLAGGSRKLARQREDFVIFVRPTIL